MHRSGELYTEQPIVLYEYQKTRHSDHPKEFYKNYNGILVTDGLEQYHKISGNWMVLLMRIAGHMPVEITPMQ